MQTKLKVQLSAFMFLQYFIWGAWYVSMGTYMDKALKFGGQEIGAAYGAFAIGSMISPFFVGLIADRYFASEKLLGFLGLMGGLVMCLLPFMKQFLSFYSMLIVYCTLYAPTLALGNSLSLHHLADAKKDFPRVKSLSAVGWIAGGVVISLLKAEQTAVQFFVAGAVSIAFGLFSFTLPHTPPKKVGQNVTIDQILGLDALALLKKRSFAIFVVCMFLICIPLYFYFVNMAIYLKQLNWTYVAGKMTLAQVSDVVFLIVLPIMLKRLGYKITILIGILAWAARYFFLTKSVAASPEALQTGLIFAAIILHGVCYDFLFIAGQLYVDGEANERIRGAAQGFIAFILWGIGAFVGTMLAGRVMQAHQHPKPAGFFAQLVYEATPIKHDWAGIWIYPALGASAVLIFFLIFFREPKAAAAPRS